MRADTARGSDRDDDRAARRDQRHRRGGARANDGARHDRWQHFFQLSDKAL